MKLILLVFALYATTCANAKRLHKKVYNKPTNASDVCANQPDGTVLKHLTDCNKFICCIHHVAEEYSCPPEYYFDANFAICLRIENTPEHKCNCIMPEHSVLMNPDDCTTYYACANGKAVLHRCPAGQYYEERISACLIDINSVCVIQPTVSPQEMALLQLCQDFGKQSYITQADPSDCNKFFLCLNGNVYTEQCDKGFYYDKYLHICRLDTDNICINQNITKVEGREEIINEKELLENIESIIVDDRDNHSLLEDKLNKNIIDISKNVAVDEQENAANISIAISDNMIPLEEFIKTEVDNHKNNENIIPNNSQQNVINKPITDKLHSKFMHF